MPPNLIVKYKTQNFPMVLDRLQLLPHQVFSHCQCARCLDVPSPLWTISRIGVIGIAGERGTSTLTYKNIERKMMNFRARVNGITFPQLGQDVWVLPHSHT